MDLKKIIITAICVCVVNTSKLNKIKINTSDNEITDNVFNGVYSECFLRLSYTCLQRKTLLYLKELNNLSEVSVIGDYMKFVKVNNSDIIEDETKDNVTDNSDELAFLIDKAIDHFFENHVIKFNALGRDISTSRSIDEFVSRKKRKGGGGGGDHGGDHDGKKKIMMMAMMCMKMKLMMMVPAMMGMMGMMSFKGMMFSMMSFMIAKMMLLMKLLEKRGSAGAGGGLGGGVGDGGWAAAGGGGGAWMPAGGQDYGGGGYDANAQWQSRSIIELHQNQPRVSISPTNCNKQHCQGNNAIFLNKYPKELKSRNKRDIIDVLQSTYTYWINKLFGSINRSNNINNPKYKIINGVKHIFYPLRTLHRIKTPKETIVKHIEQNSKPIIATEDFNKGEIFEGVVESRMNRKKFHKMKESVNNTMDDNPWE